ncbi:TPA: hypothetical protein ACTNYD_003779 [Escherichia coli]
MAENRYGLAGQGMGKVKSINQYRLTPGFGGFTPVSHVTTACRLPYHIICPFPAVQIRFPAEVDPDLICC